MGAAAFATVVGFAVGASFAFLLLEGLEDWAVSISWNLNATKGGFRKYVGLFSSCQVLKVSGWSQTEAGGSSKVGWVSTQ